MKSPTADSRRSDIAAASQRQQQHQRFDLPFYERVKMAINSSNSAAVAAAAAASSANRYVTSNVLMLMIGIF